MPRVENVSYEERIRTACEQLDYSLAVEIALRALQPEMRRFLSGVLRNQESVQDVFGAFTEQLWQGLPRFRWESSFRTWAYRLLRGACYQFLHSPAAREEVTDAPIQEDIPDPSRSVTQPWLKTEIKQAFIALRQKLDAKDRMLLLLRVDQRLPWEEIARIVEESDTLTEQEVRQKAAALRQHFQRVKDRLRELAIQEGLISPEES